MVLAGGFTWLSMFLIEHPHTIRMSSREAIPIVCTFVIAVLYWLREVVLFPRGDDKS